MRLPNVQTVPRKPRTVVGTCLTCTATQMPRKAAGVLEPVYIKHFNYWGYRPYGQARFLASCDPQTTASPQSSTLQNEAPRPAASDPSSLSDDKKEQSTSSAHFAISKPADTARQPARPSPYKRPCHMTHYDVIGVDSTASADIIRKAYIRKAKLLHPDVNPHDENAVMKFVDLHLAYQTVSDSRSRQIYDETLGLNRLDLFEKDKTPYPIRTSPDHWKQAWNTETLQEKLVRREKLKRFSQGELDDFIPGGCANKAPPQWSIGIAFATFIALVIVARNTWIDPGKDASGILTARDDSYTPDDYRTAKYVTAFLDPFTLEWSRLENGQEAPSPTELADYYRSIHGPLAVNTAAYPHTQLTTTKIPRLRSNPSVLYRVTATGELFHRISSTAESPNTRSSIQEAPALPFDRSVVPRYVRWTPSHPIGADPKLSEPTEKK